MSVLVQTAEYVWLPPGNAPAVATRDAIALPMPTETADDPFVGAAIRGRIHPRGLPCTWVVEYGSTISYGTTTTPRALPGLLAAHYREDFVEGTNGYLGGLGRHALSHVPGGVVYSAEGSAGDDINHDGIGVVHIAMYAYPSVFAAESPQFFLGGGHPDFRGAQFRVRMRGRDWFPKGTGTSSWIQINIPGEGIHRANWAHTGFSATCRLVQGTWQSVYWELENDPGKWTYCGNNPGSLNAEEYRYCELDQSLRDINVNMFPFVLTNINDSSPDNRTRPAGQIEVDWVDITYRQHSVLVASNGGSLDSFPLGSTGSEFLTDGWRNGEGREWRSTADPASDQDFIFSFASPVIVDGVMIHNATEFPSRGYEVAISEDGETWTDIMSGELPESSPYGPNFVFAIESGLSDSLSSYLRVRITSGWQSERWALGEIEAFGTGATEQTEDDWYDVNQDLELSPGTYHFRVVATTSEGTTYGPDQTVVVTG